MKNSIPSQGSPNSAFSEAIRLIFEDVKFLVMRRFAPILTTLFVIASIGFLSMPATASTKSDVAVARKALLVRSDFPKSWTTFPSGGNSELGNAQIAECLGIAKSVVDYNPPHANSPSFTNGNRGWSVDDDVAIFPSAKIATQQFNIYGSRESVSCIGRAYNYATVKAAFARQLGRGFTVNTIVARALPKPTTLDESSAFELHFQITDAGKKLSINSEIVTIMSRSRNEGAQLQFVSSLGNAFAQSFEANLVTLTVRRLD